jgi:hypothetical protein
MTTKKSIRLFVAIVVAGTTVTANAAEVSVLGAVAAARDPDTVVVGGQPVVQLAGKRALETGALVRVTGSIGSDGRLVISSVRALSGRVGSLEAASLDVLSTVSVSQGAASQINGVTGSTLAGVTGSTVAGVTGSTLAGVTGSTVAGVTGSTLAGVTGSTVAGVTGSTLAGVTGSTVASAY